MINKSSRIFVAGHTGLAGSSILEVLRSEGYEDIVTIGRRGLNLEDHRATVKWIEEAKPDAVVLAAGKVGGILANDTYPADFLLSNIQIQTNVIHASFLAGVKTLIFLGSSCIYPKMSKQPISEESLLSGSLEPTNEWYAIAKISGLKLCQALSRQYGVRYFSLMPTNLYGFNDNFDPQSSHVLPAMVRRYVEATEEGAREVVCWGSGRPRREFLHALDLARAVVFCLENIENTILSNQSHINVGFGEDISIADLATLVANVTGYEGITSWDRDKPDGTTQKLLNSKLITTLGWRPTVKLEDGLRDLVSHYRKTRK